MLKEKILLINFFVILLINNSIVKADTIEDLVNDINDIQNEMKSLSTEVSAESKILDQSIEEINKITNFVSFRLVYFYISKLKVGFLL